MKKYVCSVCGYVYDEAAGSPDEGIAPGTKWEDRPDDWVCPLCGAAKDAFAEQADAETGEAPKGGQAAHEDDMRELSMMELAALCSNLAKGCEKQYRAEEAQGFFELAEYYQSKAGQAQGAKLADLGELAAKDLGGAFANAKETVSGDRGALRALVWGEKVTTILSSLLKRYEKQGKALTENTNVFVCEICGFVYVGEQPPEICPVCKVPRFKIRQIARGA